MTARGPVPTLGDLINRQIAPRPCRPQAFAQALDGLFDLVGQGACQKVLCHHLLLKADLAQKRR
jgi:hypothetical protein